MAALVDTLHQTIVLLNRIIRSLTSEVQRLGGLLEGRGCPAGVNDGGVCPGQKQRRR